MIQVVKDELRVYSATSGFPEVPLPLGCHFRPLPVGQIWGHVTCISQSEARDGAEFQDGSPHLHI